ncbi:MAG: proton-conducting transporter membrane subunit, partial [Verrucomicrobiales bacterium]
MNMAITLFGAADAMLTSILVGRAASRLWLAATLLGLSAGLAAAVVVLGGDAERGWHSRLTLGGEALPLRLEAISAFYLMLLCVVGGAASVYEREHWADRTHPRSSHTGRVWWSVLLLSLGLVLLVSNGRPFLLAWELFTISAYFLATLNRQPAVVRAAGWLYLRAAHVAVLALFAFFTLLAARAWSWDLGPMRERADLAPLFWLALLGFGLKAGLFPLHVWLPSAHANAPSHVSAMLSGVTLKIGIYGLVRFSGWQPVAGGAGWVVAALGVVSAVL